MFVILHTNVIVVTIRISIADLIGGAATQTFAPGGKHPRAATDCIYINRGISRLLFNVHKSWFWWLSKKISEVAPQTSLDIAFGPLSEMLANHWPTITCSVPTRINWILTDAAVDASQIGPTVRSTRASVLRTNVKAILHGGSDVIFYSIQPHSVLQSIQLYAL